MAENARLKCSRCEVELKEMDAYFTYLDRKFKHKVNRCPECGQIYLDEDLVRGKVRQMETALEDK